MAENILFLTELLGLRVFDLKQRLLGRVKDLALVPLIDPVRIDRFLIGGAGYTWLTVRYDQVKRITLDGIYLRDEQLTPYHSDEYMLRVVRDLLDQQIIDAQGRKVVRVTDITFERREDRDSEVLWVLEVDIGLRSVFRRLFQGVAPVKWIRRIQTRIAPNSIRWEFCNILEADPQRRLRLNISNNLLEKMHPADLADIVEELSPEDREAIFATMDNELAAEALSEVDPDIQASILESLETEKAADILEEMSPDEAADVLAELEEETSEEILEEMDTEPKTEVRELLEYAEDTAGGMMTTEFVSLHANALVGDAVEGIRGNEELIESLNSLFLVDEDERLVAAVPVARLFLAQPGQPLRDLATGNLQQVTVDESQDRVTELFDKYNLLVLPVVDEDGRLSGVVTADDIISVLRQR
ncbi:MAG: CBS domain-containing protein [Bryobacteraceae bacterium]|nr:CBS domain-containing protein [Bryobacteraceae bacterium]